MAGSGSEEPPAKPFWRFPISDVRPTPGNLFTAAASLRLGHHLHHGLLNFNRFKIIQSPREEISPTLRTYFNGEGSGNEGFPYFRRSSAEVYKIERQFTNILLATNILTFVAQAATRGKMEVWGGQARPIIFSSLYHGVPKRAHKLAVRIFKPFYHTRTYTHSRNISVIDIGQWWRVVTFSFLHRDVMQLMLNTFWLNPISPHVESNSGPRRYLAVYFTSAITGSAMSYWFNKFLIIKKYRFYKLPSIGASGVLCGLVGSYAVHIMRHWDLCGSAKENLIAVAIFISIIALLGLSNPKRIDNWKNLGGFLGGTAASWFVGPAWKFESLNVDGNKVFINRAPITYLLNTETELRVCNSK